MNATTVAVDLAKNVFALAVADGNWKIVECARLTRAQFERWFDNRRVDLVVMEACGSAHHWARTLRASACFDETDGVAYTDEEAARATTARAIHVSASRLSEPGILDVPATTGAPEGGRYVTSTAP